MERVILWKSMVFTLHNIDLLEHNYISFVIHCISIFHKSIFYKDLLWSHFYFQLVLPLQLWVSYLLCIFHLHIPRLSKLLFKTPTRVHYNLEYVISLYISLFKKKSYSCSFEVLYDWRAMKIMPTFLRRVNTVLFMGNIVLLSYKNNENFVVFSVTATHKIIVWR